ncbi:MAG: PrsW family intramembrane metalloprotease, partial [Methanocalculus sp.]|nr:PrsW family intramembrane metalloprotease [Methanocalculus sp.]
MSVGYLRQIHVVARWELLRTLSTMGRGVLPAAIILFILLVAASGLTAQSGLHIQDGIYRLGTDNLPAGEVIAEDGRFNVFIDSRASLLNTRLSYDIVILGSEVYVQDTEKGRAALTSLEQVFEGYSASMNVQEPDLYAAYPLWINRIYERSTIDFSATQSGQRISPVPQREAPEPT